MSNLEYADPTVKTPPNWWMRRLPLFAIICLVLSACVFFLLRTPAPRPVVPSSTYTIDFSVPGTEVYMEGMLLGKVPLQLSVERRRELGLTASTPATMEILETDEWGEHIVLRPGQLRPLTAKVHGGRCPTLSRRRNALGTAHPFPGQHLLRARSSLVQWPRPLLQPWNRAAHRCPQKHFSRRDQLHNPRHRDSPECHLRRYRRRIRFRLPPLGNPLDPLAHRRPSSSNFPRVFSHPRRRRARDNASHPYPSIAADYNIFPAFGIVKLTTARTRLGPTFMVTAATSIRVYHVFDPPHGPARLVPDSLRPAYAFTVTSSP